MKVYQLWIPFVKQHRTKTIVMILLGLASSYCTLLLPLSIGKFMEIEYHTSGGKSKALQLLGINLQNTLPIFFTFFAAMLLLKFLSNWGYRFLSSLMGESFIAYLRQQLFSWNYSKIGISNIQPSVLLAFSNEVKTMQRYLVKGVIGFVKDILFLAMGIYVLFALQPQLTGIVLLLCGCFYLFYKWLNHFNKPLLVKKRKSQASLLNYVSAILLQQSATFDNNTAVTTYKSKSKKLALAAREQQVSKTFSSAFIPFLLYVMVGILLVIIAWGKGYVQPINANSAVTYILLLMMIFPAFQSFLKIETVWMEGKLSAQKFLKIVEEKKSYTHEIV